MEWAGTMNAPQGALMCNTCACQATENEFVHLSTEGGWPVVILFIPVLVY